MTFFSHKHVGQKQIFFFFVSAALRASTRLLGVPTMAGVMSWILVDLCSGFALSCLSCHVTRAERIFSTALAVNSSWVRPSTLDQTPDKRSRQNKSAANDFIAPKLRACKESVSMLDGTIPSSLSNSGFLCLSLCPADGRQNVSVVGNVVRVSTSITSRTSSLGSRRSSANNRAPAMSHRKARP